MSNDKLQHQGSRRIKPLISPLPSNQPSNNNDLSLSKDNAEVVDEKDFTSDGRTSTQRNVSPSSNEIVDVITVLDYGQSNNQIHIAIR
ncbi:unnamed protein product [Rotaria sordida]|uniref:Uncharacterized protein n=1 Tax=Rotaria sordida TaxID=392033 RepID=A0A819JK45_9BILA|nr:unnamed protein product [Rotaria sordida]CAF3934753.1 unnamed protein product [Rotaria sordida]